MSNQSESSKKRSRRPKGSGGVYRPKYKDRHGNVKVSKVYWIQWTDFSGKPQRMGAETTKKSEAEILLRKKTTQRDLGKPTDVSAERTTFSDLADMVESDYRANGRKSLSRLLRSLGHLRGFFGEYRAIQITEDRIPAYKALRQKEGAKNATINRELSALHRAFSLAYKAGKAYRIPPVHKLVEDNVRKGFLTRVEFESILEHVPPCPSDEHLKRDCYWREFFEIEYITGWRAPSEVLTRQWLHVDFDHDWLRLEPGETKNKGGRNFPFTPQLRAALERQRAYVTRLERATGKIIAWVFPNPKTGNRLKSYYHVWNEARDKAGLSNKLVHDSRRTAVRNLERANVPATTPRRWLGTSPTRSTTGTQFPTKPA